MCAKLLNLKRGPSHTPAAFGSSGTKRRNQRRGRQLPLPLGEPHDRREGHKQTTAQLPSRERAAS